MLYNVEGLEQDVQKPVIVLGPGRHVKSRQLNNGLLKLQLPSNKSIGKMVTEGRKHGLDMRTGTSLRHRRHRQRLHGD